MSYQISPAAAPATPLTPKLKKSPVATVNLPEAERIVNPLDPIVWIVGLVPARVKLPAFVTVNFVVPLALAVNISPTP